MALGASCRCECSLYCNILFGSVLFTSLATVPAICISYPFYHQLVFRYLSLTRECAATFLDPMESSPHIHVSGRTPLCLESPYRAHPKHLARSLHR